MTISLAEKMIAQGQMAPGGLKAFECRKNCEASLLEARKSSQVALPPSIEKALRSNHAAWANCNALAPGYRKQYAGWLACAVKPETRQKRLKKAIAQLERNQKLGMK